MALDPEARYPTAEDFARSLLDAAGGAWTPRVSMLFLTRASSRPPPTLRSTVEDPTTQRRPAPLVLAPPPAETPSPADRRRATTRVTRFAPLADPQAESIRQLAMAFQSARQDVLAGEAPAEALWAPAGRRLGAALVDAGRLDEAYGVLREILDHSDARVLEHALVAEQLAHVSGRRGRTDEQALLLREALEVADELGDELGDEALTARLRRALGAHASGVRPSAKAGQPASAPGKVGGSGER
jgi:hypothetical protein